MKKSFNNFAFIFFILILTGLACNMPQATSQPGTPINSASPASQAQPPTLIAFTETPTAAPASTNTITPQPTPQKPLVIKTTLCWAGPGAQFEVVSSLKQGENVEIIGRGSIAGWLIIRNPIYHDPCWAKASDLQIDASFNVNALQIYYPPPTPTRTPKPTPVPSATP